MAKVLAILPRRAQANVLRIHSRFVSTTLGARLLGYHGSRESVLAYWKRPTDDRNQPRRYLNENASRQFLTELVRSHIDPSCSLLEIGCNAGANLEHLYRAGFTRLAGIEINPDAVRLLKEAHPEMRSHAVIYNAAVEDVIRTLPDRGFDLVFTMAVLEHIHKESEWVFEEIVRITARYLITIEDERSSGWGHFRHNYGRIFRGLGLEESSVMDGRGMAGLGEGFVARVFSRRPR